MIKQKSFNYKFNKNIDEYNYFVNETNIYAFNSIINSFSNLLFLYGPKKSGKTHLASIWLKKNNAIKFTSNYNLISKKTKNILIDELSSFEEEKIFHIVNDNILNKNKVLITSNIKINNIKFKFDDLSSRLKTFSNLEIYPPNDEMLLTLLTKLLMEKQLIINSNEIF